MDKIEKYKNILIEYLEEFAAIEIDNVKEAEKQVITDTIHNHYKFMIVGWEKEEFYYNTLLHFDIKDGKIWVQQNWTELQVADDLIEKGVEKSDIVLGFQPPYARPYTGFATA